MTATLYGSRVAIDSDPDARLTVREVAQLLNRSTDYVRTLFYSNTIPNEVDERDGNYRARRGDVDAYLAGRLKSDPLPMFADLGDLADQIAAAEKLRDDLIAERGRRLVYWVDERHETVTAAAQALKRTRKRTTDLLRLARMERDARRTK